MPDFNVIISEIELRVLLQELENNTTNFDVTNTLAFLPLKN